MFFKIKITYDLLLVGGIVYSLTLFFHSILITFKFFLKKKSILNVKLKFIGVDRYINEFEFIRHCLRFFLFFLLLLFWNILL